MKKCLTVVVPALVLVIIAQWFTFSHLRRENPMLRDAQQQAGQAPLELERTVESARQSEAEVQSLRTELARVRGDFQRVREELDRAKMAADRVPLSLVPRSATVPSQAQPATVASPSRVVLTPTDIDPDLLRVVGLDNGGGNLRVILRGRSSDDIGAMAGIQKCDIVIDGQVAIGAARWMEDGTNAGLVLVFDTKAQAEAAAAALRGQRPQ